MTHAEKIRETMLKKLGSEEALLAFYKDNQAKSRTTYDPSKRTASISPERRSEIASKAAKARWNKNGEETN